MKVLAIDPGSAESAWVTWDGAKLLGHGKEVNAAVCAVINFCAAADPDVTHLAIEQIVGSYGGNAGLEVMDTAYWSGRFAQVWAIHRSERGLIRIPRKTVVTDLCGQARANDSNVRCALVDRIGAQGTKKAPGPTFGVAGDVWSALAVAVVVFDRLKQGYYKPEAA